MLGCRTAASLHAARPIRASACRPRRQCCRTAGAHRDGGRRQQRAGGGGQGVQARGGLLVLPVQPQRRRRAGGVCGCVPPLACTHTHACAGVEAAASIGMPGPESTCCCRCLLLPPAAALQAASPRPPSPPGEECYLALDKGAITDQHCLLLPVEHYPCSLAAPASTTEEMARCGLWAGPLAHVWLLPFPGPRCAWFCAGVQPFHTCSRARRVTLRLPPAPPRPALHLAATYRRCAAALRPRGASWWALSAT